MQRQEWWWQIHHVCVICRLLHDITKVDRALGFWAARLKAGQHRSFLLLGQGPTSFLLDILAVVTRKPDRRTHLSATDQIERRVCETSHVNSARQHRLTLSMSLPRKMRRASLRKSQTCPSTSSALRVTV